VKKIMLNKRAIAHICLLVSFCFIFQAQTFYGKRQLGFYETKGDGAAFGHYVPRGINRGKKLYPLVVVMSRQSTDAMGWSRMAKENEVIILAITPKRANTWWFPADINRALDKIKDTIKTFPIDKNKIWVTGYGSNGNVALVLGINEPDLITAAATVDSKVYKTVKQGYDEGDGSYVGWFDFRSKPEKQLPLLLIDYGKRRSVSPEDSKMTREILDKYGYPVTYESVAGGVGYPDQPTMKKIYKWFSSLG
jgi:hypothetical protein